jgi:hypothetical protein
VFQLYYPILHTCIQGLAVLTRAVEYVCLWGRAFRANNSLEPFIQKSGLTEDRGMKTTLEREKPHELEFEEDLKLAKGLAKFVP